MKNSPVEQEARLKALLFGRIDSNSSSGNTTPGFNSPLSISTFILLPGGFKMNVFPARISAYFNTLSDIRSYKPL